MLDGIRAMRKGGTGAKDTSVYQYKTIHTPEEKILLTEKYRHLTGIALEAKSLALGFSKTTLLTYRIEISSKRRK